jgi:hypothetical protein
MSTIQYNDTDIHHSFAHFSKLVHLSAILRRVNIHLAPIYTRIFFATSSCF